MIPVPTDQRGHRLRRDSQGDRPLAFDREAYKQRNTIERCINRMKQWRGNATRYEKAATIYLAGLEFPRDVGHSMLTLRGRVLVRVVV